MRKTIYSDKQKAQIEQKRMLLGLVFLNLRLNAGKLSINYTTPFEILANSVIATNQIFEPAKNLANTSKNRALDPAFSPMLRIVDDVRTIIQRQNEYIYIQDLAPQA